MELLSTNCVRAFVIALLLESDAISAYSADRPVSVNDAEAVAYLEEYEIDHSLDDSEKHLEQITLDDTDDVDGLLERLQTLEHIRKLAFDGNSASVKRIRTVAALYPQLLHLVIEDTGQVPVAV